MTRIAFLIRRGDFGGEVERVLSMVDSALLLVDAVEINAPNSFRHPKPLRWALSQ